MSPRLGIEVRRHRLGVHFFRWGIHFKARRRDWWGHLNVKLVREHDLGRPGIRFALWVGWWRSSKGYRGGVSGLKFAVTVVKDLKPRQNMRVPIYPRKTRDRRRNDQEP